MTQIGSREVPVDLRLTVAVCASSELVRRGLGSILDDLAIVENDIHCESWEQACQLMSATPVDILIIAEAGYGSCQLPDGVQTKVLVLVDATDLRTALKDAPPWAHGFLARQDLTPTGLDEAVRRVAVGKSQIPARLASELIRRAAAPLPSRAARPAKLTSRESEALALLADGLSNKQIARRLSISDHGAKRLVASLLLKLGSPNRTMAVVTAIKSGLIEPSLM
ncbi:response regulator transcription factor [Micromonospora sp. KC207]|uniref:response regulator transcription factor n=1 Tax=Micromonospora sp. KC207 TaxID=2530377 RepID=UPI001045CF95|nr:response regulator transcription factor [Micromonospora sp. KC207]TDC64393.1 response regulator transcription factor [Micromonospora sp. KC207]